MDVYVRNLSVADLDQSVTVEHAAFPPIEAGSREKIEFRLTVCPDLCLGLFAREGTEDLPLRKGGEVPFVTEAQGSGKDLLIAHALATKTSSPVVRDQDMDMPADWKTNPNAETEVGHNPKGRTIGLHALGVLPKYQGQGFGKALIKTYIEQARKTGQGDRISILTYDRLVPYYESVGFKHIGESESRFAGIVWQDLSFEFTNPSNS